MPLVLEKSPLRSPLARAASSRLLYALLAPAIEIEIEIEIAIEIEIEIESPEAASSPRAMDLERREGALRRCAQTRASEHALAPILQT